jgi:hypothetical protein
MHRERRFSMRATVDLPLRWYEAAGGAERVATTVDLSSGGIAFVTGFEARPGDEIVVHLRDEPLVVDLALPARVLRVNRSPGGYRLAAEFEAIDLRQRAALGKFVIALVGKPAA